MSQSATRLLGLGLTPGKFRGLQRISNPNGTLTMVATDQNSSMISMMKKATGTEPTYAEIADAKVMLSRALSPHCSGLLVDGYYGYWSTVAAMAVPSSTGLLIRVEKSGASKNKAGGPMGEFEPGWGVDKIKRCGADAVKLLAQFEPDEPDSAEHNFAFTRKVYEQCIEHDILFLLEPLHFPYNGDDAKSDRVLKRKAKTVIDSARILSRVLRRVQGRVPRHPRRRVRRPADGQPEEAQRHLPRSRGCCSAPASSTPSTRSRSRWR